MKTTATVTLPTGVLMEKNLPCKPHATQFKGAACFEIRSVTRSDDGRSISVTLELDADIEAVFGLENNVQNPTMATKCIPAMIVQVKPPPATP